MSADWIELKPAPLDAAAAIMFAGDARAGGIAVFLGTTRAETGPAGRELLALDYEAYGEMAIGQMRALGTRACEKWKIAKLVILHRTGRVALAEPSVVIAVSTAHREQAFEACRWLIDTLKAEVALWKKEIWSDGAGTWVQPVEQQK